MCSEGEDAYNICMGQLPVKHEIDGAAWQCPLPTYYMLFPAFYYKFIVRYSNH